MEQLMTPERVSSFLKGEINWSQLVGISMDQAYAIAEIGFNLLNQGRLEDAEKIFVGLCAMNPQDGYYQSVLGSIFARQDKLDDAKRALELAAKLGYEDPHVLVNKAEISLRQGKLSEALPDLERVLEGDNTTQAGVRAKAMLETVMQSIRLAQAQNDV